MELPNVFMNDLTFAHCLSKALLRATSYLTQFPDNYRLELANFYFCKAVRDLCLLLLSPGLPVA